MAETTLQEVGQFAGDMPLTGYNVQKHSVNVTILRMMPTDTVRSAITHFGTRGLFGKVTRRTAQHDKDNERRKDSRGTQALKSKPNPYPMPVPKRKCRLSSDRSVSKADARGPQPVPGPPGREIVLDFRPHPLPSSCNIAISSSPPAHSTRDIPPTTNEGRFVHDKAMYARPEALPGLGLADGTLPTSANSSSRVLPLPPTTTIPCHDPAVGTPSQYAVHADQARASLDVGYAPPMPASSGQMVDAPPFNTEPTGSGGASDASRSAQTSVVQAYPASLGVAHTFNAPASNQSVVRQHIDARVAESLSTQRRPLHQEEPRFSNLGAPRAVPSGYPFATFANPDSLSNRVPLHFNYFAESGTTHAWSSSQAARDRYANEVETTFAPYAPTPAMTHRNAPLDNGYATSMWGSASRERDGSVSSPLTAYYSPYPASWSHAATFDPCRPRDGTPTHASTMQSDGLPNALVNCYPGPRSVPYGDNALAVPSSADPVANRGLIHSSTSALQTVRQMDPQPGIAPIAGHSVNAFTGGWTQVDASASCLCAECIPREANYAQGFEGCFNARNPSWMPSIPVSHTYDAYVDYARGQWDDGPAYLNVPSSCFPPTLPLTPGPFLGQAGFST